MNKISACVAIGSCVTGFVASALPYLQAIALIVSIIAGVLAFIRPRGK